MPRPVISAFEYCARDTRLTLCIKVCLGGQYASVFFVWWFDLWYKRHRRDGSTSAATVPVNARSNFIATTKVSPKGLDLRRRLALVFFGLF